MRTLALPLLLAAVALFGCARTDIAPSCPDGFDPVGGRCLCNTDDTCPVDEVCHQGTCVCNGDACCPTGYTWDVDGGACACHDSSCCPVDYAYDPGSGACACAAASCCPVGFAFNPSTKACVCNGDQCCPHGFVFVARDGGADAGEVDAGLPPPLPDGGGALGACACEDDSCCPVDYRYDSTRQACVCAEDSCCPPDYRYDSDVKGCVCNGDACCPAGFTLNSTLRKCVCGSDAACDGLTCDTTTGSCVCTPGGPPGTGGCKSTEFCNSLGFCQTLSGCTDNSDCPTDTFCNLFTAECTTDGPCTVDANCPLDQICDLSTAACTPGCRSDDDCVLKESCQIPAGESVGTCSDICETNQFCDTQEFCGPNQGCADGTCCPANNPAFCAPCDDSSFGNCPAPNECLQFIQEGQTALFCGVSCQTDADCPGGYDCGPTLHDCSQDPQSCALAGDGTTCMEYMVVNEPDPLFLCAGSDGQPKEYESYCAPKSGRCPPDSPP